MAKKAVLVYGSESTALAITGSGEREIWVIVPEDSTQYSKVMSYVNLVSQPDEYVLAESDQYDFTAAYEVGVKEIDNLFESYDIESEVIEF